MRRPSCYCWNLTTKTCGKLVARDPFCNFVRHIYVTLVISVTIIDFIG